MQVCLRCMRRVKVEVTVASIRSSSCVELCDSSVSPEPSGSKAAGENCSMEKVEMKDASVLVKVSEVRTRNQQVLEGSTVGSLVLDEE